MHAPHHGPERRYAEMLAAIGTEPRLRILRRLAAAGPGGVKAGDLSTDLAITPSTLSHHLDRLKREQIVRVRRQGTCIWYSANLPALDGLVRFLAVECGARSETPLRPAQDHRRS